MKISLRSTHLWNVFNLKVVRSAFFKFIAMEIFVSSTGQSMLFITVIHDDIKKYFSKKVLLLLFCIVLPLNLIFHCIIAKKKYYIGRHSTILKADMNFNSWSTVFLKFCDTSIHTILTSDGSDTQKWIILGTQNQPKMG